MKLLCTWDEKLRLTAAADGHSVSMDTKPPMGTDTAMTPKQLVLAGLCGCTAMDVLSLLKKYKEPLEGFEIEAEASTTTGHPIRFAEIRLRFRIRGAVSAEKALEAVSLSQTRFCGVSAMLSKAVPVRYEVLINEAVAGTGEARFEP